MVTEESDGNKINIICVKFVLLVVKVLTNQQK